MKALTLRQPWASLIARGTKIIETRSWSTRYRGPLAIHAAARRPQENEVVGRWEVHEMANGSWMAIDYDGDDRLPLPLGAVVATCRLVDVVPMVDDRFSRHCLDDDGRVLALRLDDEDGIEGIQEVTDQRPYGDFTPGRWAWLLADVQPHPPVPARGRQGLWEWT